MNRPGGRAKSRPATGPRGSAFQVGCGSRRNRPRIRYDPLAQRQAARRPLPPLPLVPASLDRLGGGFDFRGECDRRVGVGGVFQHGGFRFFATDCSENRQYPISVGWGSVKWEKANRRGAGQDSGPRGAQGGVGRMAVSRRRCPSCCRPSRLAIGGRPSRHGGFRRELLEPGGHAPTPLGVALAEDYEREPRQLRLTRPCGKQASHRGPRSTWDAARRHRRASDGEFSAVGVCLCDRSTDFGRLVAVAEWGVTCLVTRPGSASPGGGGRLGVTGHASRAEQMP